MSRPENILLSFEPYEGPFPSNLTTLLLDKMWYTLSVLFISVLEHWGFRDLACSYRANSFDDGIPWALKQSFPWKILVSHFPIGTLIKSGKAGLVAMLFKWYSHHNRASISNMLQDLEFSAWVHEMVHVNAANAYRVTSQPISCSLQHHISRLAQFVSKTATAYYFIHESSTPLC